MTSEIENFLLDPKKYIIQTFANSYRKIHQKKIDKYIDTDLRNYLEEKYNSKHIKQIFKLILDDGIEFSNCLKCGLFLDEKYYKGREFCSIKCSSSSPLTRKKITDTMLENHGVMYPAQLDYVNEKRKQTCIEKYGVDNPSKSEIVKKRRNESNTKKFGGNSPLSSHEVREKIKKTNLERYGVAHAWNNEKAIRNTKKTNLERYGTERIFGSSHFRNKSIESHKKNFFLKHNIDEVKWTNKEWIESILDSNKHLTLQEICIKFFWNVSVTALINHLRKLEIDVEKHTILRKSSRGEREIVDYISSLCSERILSSSRKYIYPYELDIYVPSKNFAIEYNGLYYHNEKSKDSKYHLMKTELARKNNIDLFHIFEDEWVEKKDIVKSMISSRLGLTKNKIHARNCDVKIISNQQSREFLEKNHIQGSLDRGKHYGLYHNDELVSMISIGIPRFNKNYSWELLRFCNKLDHIVVGGFSKLLAFIKNNITHDEKILTYADRRYSNGNLYRKFGKELKPSTPNYYWTDAHLKRIPRYKTMKHKLEKFLGTENFDPSLSERENMEANGFYKIYDCGNLVFEL